MIRKKHWPAELSVLTLAVLLVAAAAIWSPKDKSADAAYPPVLVIDAGHGGEDGGAVAPDGTLESELNLDIALRLEALARFWGVDTRMTRETDAISYPEDAHTLAEKKKADQKARVVLINDVPGAVLVSIHQNFYPAEAPNGIQVFYGKEPESDVMGVLMQENLTLSLCPANRRLAEPIQEDIYLMRMVRCPAVLVECGFLSHPEELAKLKTEHYRMELAAVLLASYQQYIRGTKL